MKDLRVAMNKNNQNVLKSFDEKSITILHKEIDLIQAIITRMARNSFYMKGWCITIVGAIFALTMKRKCLDVEFLLLLMIGLFWFLDSYYLKMERMYRVLYNKVIKKRVDDNDWSDLYSLNCFKYEGQTQNIFRIMFSISEVFYSLVFVFLILLLILKNC